MEIFRSSSFNIEAKNDEEKNKKDFHSFHSSATFDESSSARLIQIYDPNKLSKKILF